MYYLKAGIGIFCTKGRLRLWNKRVVWIGKNSRHELGQKKTLFTYQTKDFAQFQPQMAGTGF